MLVAIQICHEICQPWSMKHSQDITKGNKHNTEARQHTWGEQSSKRQDACIK